MSSKRRLEEDIEHTGGPAKKRRTLTWQIPEDSHRTERKTRSNPLFSCSSISSDSSHLPTASTSSGFWYDAVHIPLHKYMDLGEDRNLTLPILSWGFIEKCEELGRGYHGQVFRCRVKNPGETVCEAAIKIPRKNDHIGRARLIREAKILLALNGAGGIPRLIGVIRKEDPCGLVMEFVPGMDFCDFIRRYSQKKINCALENIRDAIKALHSAGYAHTDIHYGNIRVDVANNLQIHMIDAGNARKMTDNNKERLLRCDWEDYNVLKKKFGKKQKARKTKTRKRR